MPPSPRNFCYSLRTVLIKALVSRTLFIKYDTCLIRNDTILIRYGTFLAWYDTLLIRYSTFLAWYHTLLIRYSTFLAGNDTILIRYGKFFARYDTLLIGYETLFRCSSAFQGLYIWVIIKIYRLLTNVKHEKIIAKKNYKKTPQLTNNEV